MSKPSAATTFDSQRSQVHSFGSPSLTTSARSKAFLAWDDAATHGAANWLPLAEPQTVRTSNAKRFVAGAVIAVLGMLALAAGVRSVAGVSECRVAAPPAVFGTNAETQMLIRGGLPCPIWTVVASATVNELAITVAPKNGSLTHRGRTGVIYRPAANYRGTDVFEFAMRGQAKSTVRVNVTVE
jgi:hypothetical protein